MRSERLDLGVTVAPLGLDPRQGVGRAGHAHVVVVEHAAGLLLDPSCVRQRGPRRGMRGLRARCPFSGLFGALTGLVERSAGGTGCRATDAPAGEAEAVAVARHDDGPGVREREVDGRGPVALDHDGGAEQRVEQTVDRAASARTWQRSGSPAPRGTAPAR